MSRQGQESDTGEPGPQPTYDPRSWLKSGASPPPEPAPTRGTGLDGRLIAGTVALAILAAVLLLLLLLPFRDHRPAEPLRAAPPLRSTATSVIALDDKRHLADVLVSSGVPDEEVRGAMSAMAPQLAALGGPLTLEIRLRQRTAGKPDLDRLTLERGDGAGLRLDRQGHRYSVSAMAPGRAHRTRVFTVRMDQQGFYSSAITAGVDDRLISQIAAAFAYDFDFERDIGRGDVFVAVTDEAVNTQGESAAVPALLYVSLTTRAKAKAFYNFRPSADFPAGWYDATGHSAQKSLMRTPVDGARITSTFGMRVHPILGYARMHRGIDFGTPVGTPVYAAGDGTVSATGPRNGYGNYLRIDHNNHLSTAYGHLSGYPAGIAPGVAVHQGQVVAFSGNTGESTGPHLHYEVLVDGDQIDPASYVADQGTPLSAAQMTAFQAERDQIDRRYARALVGATGIEPVTPTMSR